MWVEQQSLHRFRIHITFTFFSITINLLQKERYTEDKGERRKQEKARNARYYKTMLLEERKVDNVRYINTVCTIGINPLQETKVRPHEAQSETQRVAMSNQKRKQGTNERTFCE